MSKGPDDLSPVPITPVVMLPDSSKPNVWKGGAFLPIQPDSPLPIPVIFYLYSGTTDPLPPQTPFTNFSVTCPTFPATKFALKWSIPFKGSGSSDFDLGDTDPPPPPPDPGGSGTGTADPNPPPKPIVVVIDYGEGKIGTA